MHEGAQSFTEEIAEVRADIRTALVISLRRFLLRNLRLWLVPSGGKQKNGLPRRAEFSSFPKPPFDVALTDKAE